MKLNKTTTLIIALSVSLVACGSPQGTVEGLYHAIDAGDVDEALSYFDSETKKMWGGKLSASVASQVEKTAKCGGIAKIETEKVLARGDLQVIKVNVTYEKSECKQASEIFKLVKSGGSWRIVIL